MNVRAEVDSSTTSVGGRVLLTLHVEGTDAVQIAPPALGTDLGGFLVRSATPGAAADSGVASTIELVLVATKPGAREIAPVELKVKTSAGAETTLVSPAVPVVVHSNLSPEEAQGDSAASAATPADYTPPLDAPRDWRPLAIALVLLVLATAVGIFILRKLRARRRRPVPVPLAPAAPKKSLRPAWEIALEELDRIVAADHVAGGALDAQYVEVADALRRYLEDRYGVPALESTTDELAVRLEHVSLPAAIRARILSVLGEADLVKFAKARPEPTAARAIEKRGRELVLETIPRPTHAGVADPTLAAPRAPLAGGAS